MATSLLRSFRTNEVIAQSEIEFLLDIENEMRQLRRIYDDHAAEVLRALRAGGRVEPGTHTAEIQDHHDGPIYSSRLVLH